MSRAGEQDLRPVSRVGRIGEVFGASLRLGLTSFGGPIAHLGYFRDEYVVRRKWLDEPTYADLVALCQFLPGPASSQVGIAIGQLRAGYLGAIAAWIGFTLPSAVALVLFAYGVDALGGTLGTGWLHGLKVVAVAVVAQAVLGMMRALAPDRERATLAVAAAAIVLAVPTAWGQIGAIALGGIIGLALRTNDSPANNAALPITVSRTTGAFLLGLFFVLLIGLPLLAATVPSQSIKLFDAFYRAGSLVFGGGHVVLFHLDLVPFGKLEDRMRALQAYERHHERLRIAVTEGSNLPWEPERLEGVDNETLFFATAEKAAAAILEGSAAASRGGPA